jgi:hypothetical protein
MRTQIAINACILIIQSSGIYTRSSKIPGIARNPKTASTEVYAKSSKIAVITCILIVQGSRIYPRNSKL